MAMLGKNKLHVKKDVACTWGSYRCNTRYSTASTFCVTMVSDLHSERGRTELWLRSSITLFGWLMFSAHSFSDNVSHTSTVCTRDMIKHRYTTFCILYEIYFSAISNYTSDLAINSPDTLKDHISECVTSFDTAGSTTVSQVT